MRATREVDDLLCAEELICFIGHLEQPDTFTFLDQKAIRARFSTGSLLHRALFAKDCYRCEDASCHERKYPCTKSEIQGFSQVEPDSLAPTQLPKAWSSLPNRLYRVQSTRLPILVFILTMLLDLKERSEGLAHVISPTLLHFFQALERAMYDNGFHQSPKTLENILSLLIRGFDIGEVSCSATTELCLLHQDFATERFPQWPFVFSVMRTMGAVRRLSRETKQVLELQLMEVLLRPRSILTGGMRMYELTLGNLKDVICRELSV